MSIKEKKISNALPKDFIAEMEDLLQDFKDDKIINLIVLYQAKIDGEEEKIIDAGLNYFSDKYENVNYLMGLHERLEKTSNRLKKQIANAITPQHLEKVLDGLTALVDRKVLDGLTALVDRLEKHDKSN